MTQNPSTEKPTAEMLDPDGSILHAEMSFGAGLIMFGTATVV